MSRSWIKFLNCYYGYGIKFNKVFKGTPYAIDEYYEHIFQEYEQYIERDGEIKGKEDFEKYNDHVNYDCSSLMLLRKEYDEYISQKRPDLKDMKNNTTLIVTCDKFIGIDETFGHPNSVWIVLGHRLNKERFASMKSDDNAGLNFPDGFKTMFADFMTRFYLKHCLNNSDNDEKLAHITKEEFEKDVKLDVFANVGLYDFLKY